jgi:hypothetical protein
MRSVASNGPSCRKFGLPVEVHMIRLDKGEHKKADYLQINPLGKVRPHASFRSYLNQSFVW